MSGTDISKHHVLIAEYTLGLLGPHDTTRAHKLLSESDEAVTAALDWENGLLGLTDVLPAVDPSPLLLHRIQTTLGHDTTPAPSSLYRKPAASVNSAERSTPMDSDPPRAPLPRHDQAAPRREPSLGQAAPDNASGAGASITSTPITSTPATNPSISTTFASKASDTHTSPTPPPTTAEGHQHLARNTSAPPPASGAAAHAGTHQSPTEAATDTTDDTAAGASAAPAGAAASMTVRPARHAANTTGMASDKAAHPVAGPTTNTASGASAQSAVNTPSNQSAANRAARNGLPNRHAPAAFGRGQTPSSTQPDPKVGTGSPQHTAAATAAPSLASSHTPDAIPITPPSSPRRPPDAQQTLAGNIWVWRAATVVFAGIALVLALIPSRPAQPPINIVKVAPTQAAILQAPGQTSTPGWVVTFDQQGNALMEPRVRSDIPADASVQLWTRSASMPQARSLGLVDPNLPVTVPASLMGPLGEDQLFEMTLEPEGGSPDASPSGPILFIGQVVTFGTPEPEQADANNGSGAQGSVQ